MFFSLYVWLFLLVLLLLFGLECSVIDVSFWIIVSVVLVYLGILFVVVWLGWVLLICMCGVDWYEMCFLFVISLLMLVVLLFIIVLMFSFKGSDVMCLFLDVICIVFFLMFYFLL